LFIVNADGVRAEGRVRDYDQRQRRRQALQSPQPHAVARNLPRWRNRQSPAKKSYSKRKEVATNLGRTPLIAACQYGHLAAATLLIVEHGAAINHLDNDGRSALWWAKNRVALDAAAPAARTTAVSAEKRAEHAILVAFLEFRGAT